MGRAGAGGAGPRGGRGGSDYRLDVRETESAGEDRSARCADAGGAVPAMRLPGHASDVRGPAHGESAARRAGGVGPDADEVHQCAPRGPPPRRGTNTEWERRDIWAAGPDPPALGDPGATRRAVGRAARASQPAARSP